MAEMEGVNLVNDAGTRRYRLLVGDMEVGFIEYDPIGDSALLIKHTEVAREHEGKGYGSELVRRALEDVRSQGRTVVPICPYALNWVRRHREYIDVVHADMRATI
jgi:predicted GNAT family acetyltransferase